MRGKGSSTSNVHLPSTLKTRIVLGNEFNILIIGNFEEFCKKFKLLY